MESDPCILVFPFSVMIQTLSEIEVKVKAPPNGWMLKVKSMEVNRLVNTEHKWIVKSCVLSWPLASLRSAHGWLSTALCIVISNSSSSQLSYSWAASTSIKASALLERNDPVEWGCGKSEELHFESARNISFTVKPVKKWDQRHWNETLHFKACVRHHNMLLVMIHWTSRTKRSPFSNNILGWGLAGGVES